MEGHMASDVRTGPSESECSRFLVDSHGNVSMVIEDPLTTPLTTPLSDETTLVLLKRRRRSLPCSPQRTSEKTPRR